MTNADEPALPPGTKIIEIPPLSDEQREYLHALLQPQEIDLDYVVGGPRKPRDPNQSP